MIYSHLSPTYQYYIAVTSSLRRPGSCSVAVKDPRWVATMQSEIQALQSNHTLDLQD